MLALKKSGANWVRKRRPGRLVAGTLALSACQTIPVYQEVQLPVFAGVYFSDCRQQDGAVTFSFARQGLEHERLDAEWASRANGDWSLASYSPFGQTLLQVSYQKQPIALTVSTKQATPLQALDVDKDGFLRFDRHRIGIRADEVACLLEMKLPRDWLRQVTKQSQDREALQLEVDDGQRHVTVKLGRHGLKQEWTWMFDVSWSMYWGMRSETLRFELKQGSELLLSSQSFPQLSARMIALKEEQ